MWFFAFMVAAAMSAFNVWMYAEVGEAISLAAAVFCGAVALFDLAMAVNE